MNTRIIELITNPALLSAEDLPILQSEITQHPYIQSIRALHLFGTHLYNQDQFSSVLSTTAAYTTDKKILFHLINKKKQEEKPVFNEQIEEKTMISTEKSSLQAAKESVYLEVLSENVAPPKLIFVENEPNRILFEGEENFLKEETPIIDLESTKEAGTIVIQKTEENSPKNIGQVEVSPEVSPEINKKIEAQIIINEDENQPEITNNEKIVEQVEIIENTTDLNFHGTQEFLPNVKIFTEIKQTPKYEVPKPSATKQELEMQKLIAEVEAKMKSNRKTKFEEKEEDFFIGNEVDFENNSTFMEDFSIKKEEKPKDIDEKIKIKEGKTSTENSNWKPMFIQNTVPDALIETKKQVKTAENSLDQKNSEENRPVFNVSFFSNEVSVFDTKKEEKITKIPEKIKIESKEESNVATFINTWQNWLKIDKKNEAKVETTAPIVEKISPIETAEKVEVKSKVIEKFIDTEPKISRLKEESSFVVKDKGENISHLITETLAKLYTQQKLYTKAVKAYETLIEKHPEKEAYFREQIQAVKNLKN